MLKSTEIQRRQSEIRSKLADLVGKDKPDEAETREIDALDAEYRSNETRYRGALIAEAEERSQAADELETRSDVEWRSMLGNFELRQVALHLDEGTSLTGQTAEIVTEMRSQGGYRGIPVPLEALEVRAGETTGSDVVVRPERVQPIIDRLFAASVATQMGARVVNIAAGTEAYPIVTSAVAAGWQNGETADVAGPTTFTTAQRGLEPDQTLGIQMKVTRRAMKQSQGLEEAIRRDMSEAIRVQMDAAAFQGTGTNGQPNGIIAERVAYGITTTDIGAAPTWDNIREQIVSFMTLNAANGPGDVRIMIRPEIWDAMSNLISGIAISEYDRMSDALGAVVQSSNALLAPSGDPLASNALMTTNAGGVAPFLIGLWGGVDLIRDPYSDAASGQLRLTGLLTADVNVLRTDQMQVLTGLQSGAA